MQSFSSDARKQVAVCIAGQVPRIFAQVEETMSENVIAPFGDAADTYIAASGFFQRPLRIKHANLTMVPASISSSQVVRMATTMQACYSMIKDAELRLGHRYNWVVRLRSDGLYAFTWHVGSVWTPTSERVVYTTHCASHEPFVATDCASDSTCLADQFAVISRPAARAYLTGILDVKDSTSGRIPECVFGQVLARARVTVRALRLCGCGCHDHKCADTAASSEGAESGAVRVPLAPRLNWSPSGGETGQDYLLAHAPVLNHTRYLPVHTYRFPLAHK